MTRIVSLLPGATEIVCALGLESNLVGRSHECDFPNSVEALPVVSRPRLDPGAASAEIDRSVKTLVSKGLSVFEIDAAQLRALKPDVIVTQIQCEVCAVSEDDVRLAVSDWLGAKPRVVSVAASSVAQVWQDIIEVGRALERDKTAHALTDQLRQRFASLAQASSARDPRPSVLGIEWVQPLMASGNWIPELITAAGGTPVLAEAGQHSPWINWAQVVEANPDIIIVSPCGFSLQRAANEVAHLRALPGWADLHAVRERRVFAFEGHHYLHRPGPRLVESAEYIARLLGADGPDSDTDAFRHVS